MPARKTVFALGALFVASLFTGCGTDTAPGPPETVEARQVEFVSHRVVDNAEYWWALAVGDVDADGLQDVVYINNNANGGYLGYRSGSKSGNLWAETIVAEAPPAGGTFAAGDLEVADMNGDGTLDILAVKHTGEWDDAGAAAEIFYYAAPDWRPVAIGPAKDAVKDLSVEDFNADGLPDLAVLTFDERNLRVHQQQGDGTFRMVQDITLEGLHEGMDVGDINSDGKTDIIANGYAFLNPGDDLSAKWTVETIHPGWNTQTGDWSANGTKTFFKVIDGAATVFMSHSERAGYPLASYTRNADGTYTETVIIDDWPAAHTLQVYDMDGDGDEDIVTGINSARAVNLDPRVEHHEVIVLLRQQDGSWKRKIIDTGGIYNGRVADFEGDGDYDLFRYPNHEAKDLFWVENTLK